MVLAEDAAVGSTVLEVVAHLCNLSLPALYEINRGFATAEMVNVLRTGSLILEAPGTTLLHLAGELITPVVYGCTNPEAYEYVPGATPGNPTAAVCTVKDSPPPPPRAPPQPPLAPPPAIPPRLPEDLSFLALSPPSPGHGDPPWLVEFLVAISLLACCTFCICFGVCCIFYRRRRERRVKPIPPVGLYAKPSPPPLPSYPYAPPQRAAPDLRAVGTAVIAANRLAADQQAAALAALTRAAPPEAYPFPAGSYAVRPAPAPPPAITHVASPTGSPNGGDQAAALAALLAAKKAAKAWKGHAVLEEQSHDGWGELQPTEWRSWEEQRAGARAGGQMRAGGQVRADAWGDPVGYAPPPAPPQLAPLSSLPVVLGERRASLPPIPAGLALGDRSSSRDYSPTRTPPRRF